MSELNTQSLKNEKGELIPLRPTIKSSHDLFKQHVKNGLAHYLWDNAIDKPSSINDCKITCPKTLENALFSYFMNDGEVDHIIEAIEQSDTIFGGAMGKTLYVEVNRLIGFIHFTEQEAIKLWFKEYFPKPPYSVGQRLKYKWGAGEIVAIDDLTPASYVVRDDQADLDDDCLLIKFEHAQLDNPEDDEAEAETVLEYHFNGELVRVDSVKRDELNIVAAAFYKRLSAAVPNGFDFSTTNHPQKKMVWLMVVEAYHLHLSQGLFD